ncbi:MAG: hypothetical protein B6D61_08385, partial [Bacteroidetes bacterium 4484_249]
MKKHLKFLLTMAFGLFILQSYPQNNLCPQWEVISDGDDWDVVSDMKKDARGNIYVTGNFTASTGFGPNTDKLTGDNSAFVAKFTGDGDEDAVMLLLDALLDFSVSFLPEKRGGKMDAPL